ncbi:hypothetical protein FACS1894111_12560 [Clostridia bacterium]|nr:hypothetical protein FACS1894111_12560 [Clostridia bacterium]
MNDTLSYTFSERIRKLRTARGMNQGQFADFVGVSRGAMSYYEQEARTPDIAVLKSICVKCNVSADYMLGIIPDPNHAVSDVCRETGLYPNVVKRLNLIKQIHDIKSGELIEIIVGEFDDPDEAMRLTPFTAATSMTNLLLSTEEGMTVLLLLSAIIFGAKLDTGSDVLPIFRFPNAHSGLEISYSLQNLTAALWVNVQEEVAKLRDRFAPAEDNGKSPVQADKQ